MQKDISFHPAQSSPQAPSRPARAWLVLAFALMMAVLPASGSVAEEDMDYTPTYDSSKGPCSKDSETSTYNKMKKNRGVYTGYAVQNTYDNYQRSLEYDWENSDKVKDMRRHPEDQYCIAWLYKSFDLYRWLAESGSKMAALIEQAVGAIVSQIANWACKAVATAINTALSMMCVPVPNLSMNLSLPSISGTSCSGYSLSNLAKVQAGQPFGPRKSIPSLNYGLRRVVPNTKTEKLEVF